MKFFLKDFFSKCDQIRSFLWIWLYLLKKSLMENFIFCAVLFPMHSWRCEPQQIYKETSLILCPNNFLLDTLFWRHASSDVQKVELVCLYTCRQLSVFPNNSVRICLIRLKISMLYQINNTFRNTVFRYVSLCFQVKIEIMMYLVYMSWPFVVDEQKLGSRHTA